MANRDVKVAEELLVALSEPGQAFIYVDKFGTHFPYHNKYPAGRELFKPSTTSSSDALQAHYKNAVNWSVDEFFRKIWPSIDFDSTLLVYTADHGQTFDRQKFPGPHCNSIGSIGPEETSVPLFVATRHGDWNTRLRSAAVHGKDHASHFQILPTLLKAMGYGEDAVRETLGPSLLDTPPPARSLVGSGKAMRWNERIRNN